MAVNYTGTTQRTEFSYDGLNRCVKVVEKTGTTVNSTRRFVLCGTEKCEYRNATGALQLQLFSQGQYQGTGAYFYTRDHLGSIREMTDASGAVVARYDYDPWGRSTTVIGTNKPEFNFTGLYQHAKSGLDMAAYRFYDPDLGRWLNRDPSGESGGLNLYGYANNNVINRADSSGLDPIPPNAGQQAQIDNALGAMQSLTHVQSISQYYPSLVTRQILIDPALGNSQDGATRPGSDPSTIRLSPRVFAFGESPVGSQGELGNIPLIVTLIHEDILLMNYDHSFFGYWYNWFIGNRRGEIDHDSLEGNNGLDDINQSILSDLALKRVCQ